MTWNLTAREKRGYERAVMADAEAATQAEAKAAEATRAAGPRHGLDVEAVYREVKQAHGM